MHKLSCGYCCSLSGSHHLRLKHLIKQGLQSPQNSKDIKRHRLVPQTFFPRSHDLGTPQPTSQSPVRTAQFRVAILYLLLYGLFASAKWLTSSQSLFDCEQMYWKASSLNSLVVIDYFYKCKGRDYYIDCKVNTYMEKVSLESSVCFSGQDLLGKSKASPLSAARQQQMRHKAPPIGLLCQ